MATPTTNGKDRIEPTTAGYRVWDADGDWLGDVLKQYPPSHIRRGRAQVSPQWLPVYQGSVEMPMQQSRKNAIESLHKARNARPTAVLR